MTSPSDAGAGPATAIAAEGRGSGPQESTPGAGAASSGSEPRPRSARPRFYALDALRGLAVVLMIFVNWAGNSALPTQFGHSEWHGLTLADAVFPTFLVAVGASMPYATRTGWRRAWGRAAMLYLIGSALVSFKSGRPFGLSVGVLQLTAVAYILTWLVTRLPRRAQTPLVGGLLVAWGAASLWVPAPGVVAGAFGPGTTIGEWLDAALGMAPHPENPHAWLPAVGSVYIGVLAGRISRERPERRTRNIRLLTFAGALLGAGLVLSTVIPVNKFLWSPSFVLVTGGLAVLVLVLLDLLIPAGSKGSFLRPLVLVGGHPIVVYAFSEAVVARVNYTTWPTLEPVISERWGELAAGVAFPLAAVTAGVLLAWAMERAGIHIRV